MEKKTFHITGMTCQHCVARVKKALESASGISGVHVFPDNNTVVLEAEQVPSLENLNSLLEEYGDYRLQII